MFCCFVRSLVLFCFLDVFRHFSWKKTFFYEDLIARSEWRNRISLKEGEEKWRKKKEVAFSIE
jgi:hypothetical protein